MALGPGKYDALCTLAREATGADGAILIIVNGQMGSGFSCQLDSVKTSCVNLALMLEDMARQIRADDERIKAAPETSEKH